MHRLILATNQEISTTKETGFSCSHEDTFRIRPAPATVQPARKKQWLLGYFCWEKMLVPSMTRKIESKWRCELYAWVGITRGIQNKDRNLEMGDQQKHRPRFRSFCCVKKIPCEEADCLTLLCYPLNPITSGRNKS